MSTTCLPELHRLGGLAKNLRSASSFHMQPRLAHLPHATSQYVFTGIYRKKEFSKLPLHVFIIVD